MIQYVLSGVLIASLSSGCGTFAAPGPAAPASHHAQRAYDEAIRKGAVVPAPIGKQDRL